MKRAPLSRIPWYMSGLFVKKITNFQNSGTSADGRWKLSIPVLPGGRYEVGIFFLKIWRGAPMLLYSSFVLKRKRMRLRLFSILLCPQKTIIEGVVVDENENPLEGAYIYAWNHDGLEIDTISDEKGKFKLNTSSGSI